MTFKKVCVNLSVGKVPLVLGIHQSSNNFPKITSLTIGSKEHRAAYEAKMTLSSSLPQVTLNIFLVDFTLKIQKSSVDDQNETNICSFE